MSGGWARGAAGARAGATRSSESQRVGGPGGQGHPGLRPRVNGAVPGLPAERVLVVGEDRRRIGMLVERLVHAGYTAMQAASPTEAVRLARDYQPIAVLLEARGPAGALRQQLRTDARTRHIPVATGQSWMDAGGREQRPSGTPPPWRGLPTVPAPL